MGARQSIARRIKELREASGLSQAALGRQVGVERQQVAAWENERNKPAEDTMLAVAKALATSVSYLYGETDDPRPAPDWRSGTGPSSEGEARVAEARRFLGLALEQLSPQPTSKGDENGD